MLTINSRQRGYSLIEFMTSLSILAIVFTFCNIQFGAIIARQFNYYQVKRVQEFIYFARSAASAVGAELSMCRGTQYGCNDSALQWVLWQDSNNDQLINDNETVRQILKVDRVDISQNRALFRFKADGSIWPNGSITICSLDEIGPSAKITLLYTGKISYLQDNTNAILCINS